MKDTIFDDFALERTIKEKFGIALEVGNVIVSRIPVSHTAIATVFLTSKKQLYVFIDAQSRLSVGDVKKILTRMGLRAEIFLPPRGQSDYFEEVARERFRAVFPGRTHITSDDLIYYKTLVPYNPALVQIQEIPNGEIRQFDTDAHGDWRVAVRFAYRRIKTS